MIRKTANARRMGGPRALGASVARLTRPAVRRRGLAEAGIIIDWPRIVGPELAAASCPERLTGTRRGGGQDAADGDGAEGGILHLRVVGALATELQHLEPIIIERVNGFFGYRAVARLRIVQGALPPRDQPRRRAPPRDDPEVGAAVDTALVEIADDSLRAALAELGRAVARKSERDG